MSKPKLHPENERRAHWAFTALDTFCREVMPGPFMLLCEDDRADAVADLICDLGHLSEVFGIDYEAALRQAASNWAHESAPDYQGD